MKRIRKPRLGNILPLDSILAGPDSCVSPGLRKGQLCESTIVGGNLRILRPLKAPCLTICRNKPQVHKRAKRNVSIRIGRKRSEVTRERFRRYQLELAL